MMLTVDSVTKDKDELGFVPINAENPFSFGKPDNWSNAELDWLKY